MELKEGIYIEVVKIVDGKPVRLKFSTEINKAINLADTVSKSVADKEIVVTSGFEGGHGSSSLHYTGNAVDIRTFIYTKDQIKQIVSELKSLLGKDYDILIESDHIHIEYDPKSKW